MTLLFEKTPCQSTGSSLLDALNNTETPMETNGLFSCIAGNGLGLHYLEIPVLKGTPVTVRQPKKATDSRTDARKTTCRSTPSTTAEIMRKPQRESRLEVRRSRSKDNSRAQAVARLSSIIKTDRQNHWRRIEMLSSID